MTLPAVPADVRALSSLPAVDYADLFSHPTTAEATPQQWARAVFGDVPDAGQLLIWRVLLQLRLSRGRSPDTVAGWRIGDEGPDWIRLEADSWFLHANLVVRTAGGRLSLATFLHYHRLPSRLVWPPLSAGHRRVVPRLLRDTVAEVERGGVRRHRQGTALR